MSKNNDVFKTLFLPDSVAETSGNVADLANGEWGVFNYDTGVAINVASAPTLPPKIFIAYKGDGTIGVAGEMYTSAGSHIQVAGFKEMTISDDAAAVSQVFTLSALDVQSGSTATNYDYGLKIDFRGNSDLYVRFGANQASKLFMANTKPVGTGSYSSYAEAEVVAQWALAISRDTDQFLSFTITGTGVGTSGGVGGSGTPGITFTASGTPGSAGAWTDNDAATAAISITEAEAMAFIRAGTAAMVMAITVGTFSSMYSFCGVNPKYFKQRGIHAIPSLVGDDILFGTITATTAMVYEKGRGYDIQELEYLSGGFTGNPGPYRQSRLNGLPFSAASFQAVSSTFYTVVTLEYVNKSLGGWETYESNISTHVILQATPTNTAGYPRHALNLVAVAAGAVVTSH